MFAKEQPQLNRNRQIVSRPPAAANIQIVSKPPAAANIQIVSKPPAAANKQIVSKPSSAANIQIVSKPPRAANRQIVSKPPAAANRQIFSKPPAAANRQIVSKPPAAANRQIVSKPPAAAKGPAMAAPNQNALSINNNNRRPLVDIGNLVGALNAQCNISKNGARKRAFGDMGNLVEDLDAKCIISKVWVKKRPRTNFGVNANKGASSSTQQLQGQGIVVRGEQKAWGGIVWGNKQSCAIKMNAQHATATQRGTAISISDSIDSSVQDGGVKTPSQLKAWKQTVRTVTATLTARSEDSLRDVLEVPPSIDDGDRDNPLAVVEYVEDIYRFYRKIEVRSCVPPDYMTRQLEIKDSMRGVIIDWLIEVHRTFLLMPETLYLTVNIIDRYLSIQSVTRNELQLVAITAMFIASKYEEISPPKISDFVYITKEAYTSKQIVNMERTILNRLKFKLTVPTPYVFLVRFLKAAGPDKVMKNLAFFLVDLCLLHYKMIKYSPSMLAAAAVYTAQCTLKKHPYWNKTLILHTGYSEAHLKECAHLIADLHLKAEGSNLKSVYKKYSYPIFGSVAFLSPAKIPAGTVAAPAIDKCAHQIYLRNLR